MMLPAILLTILAVGYRIALAFAGETNHWAANFSPCAAIVLCGAAFFPKQIAITVPLVMMLASDWLLNSYVYHVTFWSPEILPRYLALGLVCLIGWQIRAVPKEKTAFLFAGTLIGTLLFYIVTNSGSWIGNPAYAKTSAGWLQALTIGEPGYPQTWKFFRNSLLSDLLFTALFWLSWKVTEKRSFERPVAVDSPVFVNR